DITVISGGTATNHILDAFHPDDGYTVTYVLPVSDNGGSSSEILRVLGGCAIGDIRSRLVRLIPSDHHACGIRGVRDLLSYRLPLGTHQAKYEWSQLVDGTHPIWGPVDSALKVLLLSFLIHVDMEIHKRARLAFRFELASVGNLFLTGARLFFGDLDSAIELICRVCRLHEHVSVCGCLNTNFTYHIAAILCSGEVIRGQSQISHPSPAPAVGPAADPGQRPPRAQHNRSVEDLVGSSLAHPAPASDDPIHPSLGRSQLHFEKDDRNVPPLPSPIARLIYISPYGEEIHPRASPRTLAALARSDAIVYSIGSLWTSVVPVLLLRGVGEQVVRRRPRGQPPVRKVLLLNSDSDRETRGLDGAGFVRVVVAAVEYSLAG
ncbi:hypothetical protein PICMEDRAFT_27772, partial [Pichia membranifaciens NRRL Y-2026]